MPIKRAERTRRTATAAQPKVTISLPSGILGPASPSLETKKIHSTSRSAAAPKILPTALPPKRTHPTPRASAAGITGSAKMLQKGERRGR